MVNAPAVEPPLKTPLALFANVRKEFARPIDVVAARSRADKFHGNIVRVVSSRKTTKLLSVLFGCEFAAAAPRLVANAPKLDPKRLAASCRTCGAHICKRRTAG